jgi:translation initiation factor IF-2
MAVSITQTLDLPTAKMVAEELGVAVETVEEASEAIKVTQMLSAEDLENLQRRPPVVTIMGHVDHGKTTLLDAIRKTKVAQGEAGGITQHIGAYHVDVDHEGEMQQVVFLDTPGHEAFTAMRARGARVTDIAILVVAADDGVRPQTIEAISHAKAAEVPIIVAINKIDKAGAQPDRVKQELTDQGLQPEEWGGDTIMVPVSAIQGENLDTLLEMILLVADIEELSANPVRSAKGTVIEANLDKTRGPVATLLVQNGTLRVGDTLVAGSVLGKVRAMTDDRGARVEAAGPSFAVEVLGLSDVPAAGDEFEVFENEKEARSVASQRTDEQRQSRLQQVMASRRVTLNSLSAQAQEGELKELNLILKADVQGSVEAILGALKQLPQNEVQIRVLLTAAGEITETDVDLAAASGAVIIGFNTTLAHGARQAADREGIDVREYNIIYKLLDDIQGAMEGLLEPELVEEPLGQVEVRAVFPVGRGAVAGCYVQSGKAVRNCNIRVRRNSKVIYEGILDSLKRMKDDAKEVAAGYECGIGLDKFNDWAEGDIIETFKMVSKRRTLSAS